MEANVISDSDAPGTGVYERTEKGFDEVLDALGVRFLYDVRTQQPWLRWDDGEWSQVTDRSEAHLRRLFAEHALVQDGRAKDEKLIPWRPQDIAWKQFRNAHLYSRETDFFVEALEALPAWDGHRRIDVVLEYLFRLDSEMRPLTEWVSRYLFVGAVKRAFEPGCKLDTMPILVGPQGCGKSTLLRELLPRGRFSDGWFTDKLSLTAPDQKRAEALLGRVLVEVGEMAGLRKSEIEDAKQWLTATDDGAVRLAYRRNPEPLPRRCILVGTANPDDPIPADPTGTRRFAAVNVDCVDGLDGWDNVERIRDWLGGTRDMLWAEALHLYRQGWNPEFPREAAALQVQSNEVHVESDEVMQGRVGVVLSRMGPERVRLYEVCDEIFESGATMAEQRRVANALRALGWSKRRTSAGKVWSAPEGWGDEPVDDEADDGFFGHQVRHIGLADVIEKGDV